ncbi:hypothetical protein JFQ86_00610 [Serratia ureilytica]|uniref:hypothetical protein n=1 Tax=Serratia ureilytica TaxID=300181 RepID=UPI0018E80D2B|nr:hypothetical protein [Serratia ureilytica]MBJ2111316.1 hypothetical protein [Serratia ureilytica]
MASFTVRVELKNSDWDTYNKLHEKMRLSGYSRQVRGDNGVFYQLPDAEYVATKTLSVVQVHGEVLAIAKSLNSGPHVFVTEALRWYWTLDQA